MRTATMANARTAEGTKKELSKGLSIAFSSGAVMGMCVVGLGVLGIVGLYYVFYHYVLVDTVETTAKAITEILNLSTFGNLLRRMISTIPAKPA